MSFMCLAALFRCESTDGVLRKHSDMEGKLGRRSTLQSYTTPPLYFLVSILKVVSCTAVPPLTDCST